MSDHPILSESGRQMLGALPAYYDSILEMRVVMEAGGSWFDQLAADLAEQMNQRFASTATWDLPAWEEELGIVPAAGQSVGERRAVVKAKMRGIGKFSGRLLKNVAEAYDNGTVHVAFNPPRGTFVVTFVSTWGIPPNLADTLSAIEEILPAHLVVEYAFTYLSFGALESAGLRFEELEGGGLSFGQLEVWNPIS